MMVVVQKKQFRVGIVDQNFFPLDRSVRIRKLAASLHKARCPVTIISRGKGDSPPIERDSTTGAIIRRDGSTSQGILQRLMSHPSPFNLFWALRILKIAKLDHLTVLVASSLRTVLPAYMAARLARIPIVFDMSEYYPGFAEIVERRGFELLIKNRFFVRGIELLSVRIVDHVWVVVPEQRDRLRKMGVSEDRVTVISNTPVLNPLGDIARPPRKPIREPTRFVYMGVVTKGRGLQLVLQALALLKKGGIRPTDIVVFVVGDGPYRPKLEWLAEELGVDRYIRWFGWRPSNKAMDIVRDCDIGLIPHFVTPFTQHTIPNKVFDYMSVGLPVLTTPMRPVQSIVERESCGFVMAASAEGIAATISKILCCDKVKLRQMGRRGYEAVRMRYNWSQDEAKILQTLHRLEKNNTRE